MNQLTVSKSLIVHVIVVEDALHIIAKKNIIIITLRKKRIKNIQRRKLDLKDRKILKLIKTEAKGEK